MATSRSALPAMVIFSIVIWAAYIAADITLWPCLLIYLLNVYLMVELNNRNTLMRQYSRMVSCSYMALMLMCPWLCHSVVTLAVQFCFIMMFTLLFMTYQKPRNVGQKYWAYLFLGCASVVWPPLVIMLPLLWIGEAAYLMSCNLKTIAASLFGVLTPLWIAVPYIVYFERYDLVQTYIDGFTLSEPFLSAVDNPAMLMPQQLPIPPVQIGVEAFVLVLFIIGMVHYITNSYADKIQVRMLYNFFMLIAIPSFFVCLEVAVLPFQTQPLLDIMFSLALVSTSPLLAHYVTFTYSRLSNATVILLMLIFALVAIGQVTLQYFSNQIMPLLNI